MCQQVLSVRHRPLCAKSSLRIVRTIEMLFLSRSNRAVASCPYTARQHPFLESRPALQSCRRLLSCGSAQSLGRAHPPSRLRCRHAGPVFPAHVLLAVTVLTALPHRTLPRITAPAASRHSLRLFSFRPRAPLPSSKSIAALLLKLREKARSPNGLRAFLVA